MAQGHIVPRPGMLTNTALSSAPDNHSGVLRMRLAPSLLFALPFFPGIANAAPADLLPFQEIADLPSRSSLTLGSTGYQPPQDLSAMPSISGGMALDNFGGHDDKGCLASAINMHGLLGQNDLLSLRSRVPPRRVITTGAPTSWMSAHGSLDWA